MRTARSSSGDETMNHVSLTAREHQTVEVVKKILRTVREKLLATGPLSPEEETALEQLEKLHVAKFLHLAREKGNPSAIGSYKYPVVTGHRTDDDQSTSSFTPNRRDSDGSFSNDTQFLSSFSTQENRLTKKDRDYYSGRDPWRRQWQRRKRLELRKRVEPQQLGVDEAKGIDAVGAVGALYNELLQRGKAASSAYDLLIITLHSYFARETWPDLVESYVCQFIQRHILISAEELSEKHDDGSYGEISLPEHINECKLQVLLHLHTVPIDTEDNDAFEKALELLRTLLLSSDGANVVQKFLDEDVLDSFFDKMPTRMANIYKKLDIPSPSELNQGKERKKIADAGSRKSKPQLAHQKVSKRYTKKKDKELERPQVAKPVVKTNSDAPKDKPMVEERQPSAKKQKAGTDIKDTETATAAEVPASETPSAGDKRDSKIPMQMKFITGHPISKIIGDGDSPAVLVSVRQSPRHHASTRALQSSTSNTLSLLLQSEQSGGAARNGCLESQTDESTRLILVKAKRGYFLKKLLRAGEKDDVSNEAWSKIPDPEKVETMKCSSAKNGKKRGRNFEKVSSNREPLPKRSRKECPETQLANDATSTGINSPVNSAEKSTNTKAKSKVSDEPVQSRAARNNISIDSSADSVKLRPRTCKRHENSGGKPISKSPSKISKTLRAKTEKIDCSGTAKSAKTKACTSEGKSMGNYSLPSYAVENYVKYVNDIRRERKRGRNEEQEELFYARGTRRCSIFYDSTVEGDSSSGRFVRKCYSDEQMAPKNRSGRKMKSSLEVFHLANYLLNTLNENHSSPAVPKNLQQSLNTPIRLYKKLRLASKNNRRRSLKQFCALKFNADEFKTSVDSGGGASNCSEGSAAETDECASLELNGELHAAQEEEGRPDVKMEITVDTRFNGEMKRRGSVSVRSGLARWTSKTAQANSSDCTTSNGYFLRRRRLLSDGHVYSVRAPILSPEIRETSDTLLLRRQKESFSDELKPRKEENPVNGRISYAVAVSQKSNAKNESIFRRDSTPNYQNHSETVNGENGSEVLLNHLPSRATALLQLASGPLLCTGLTAANYAQDV